MTSRERVFARIEGRTSDKIPNLNIMMLFAAKELGVPYSEYCTDYKKLAQGNILCAERYGLDCLTTMSDPMKEAGDLGTQVVYPFDDVPYEKVSLINEASDLLKIKPIAPENGKRMAGSIRAIEYYKKEMGDEYAVIGWVEGCFAEAADLRGVSRFLMDFYDDEMFIRDLLDLCLEQAILFAKAQIQAGADIIGVGDAIASVAGPDLYKRYAREYEAKLFQAIRDAGAKTKLHICGNTTPFLEEIPVDLVDILDADHMVPLDEATKVCGAHSCISGNYDPVAVLLQGTPADVDLAVRKCAEVGNDKYISSGGCETPKGTPKENLMQVAKTLKDI